jgi:hypothetical protein
MTLDRLLITRMSRCLLNRDSEHQLLCRLVRHSIPNFNLPDQLHTLKLDNPGVMQFVRSERVIDLDQLRYCPQFVIAKPLTYFMRNSHASVRQFATTLVVEFPDTFYSDCRVIHSYSTAPHTTSEVWIAGQKASTGQS